MARPTYPSDTVDKTMVRFPAGMMDQLRRLAAENHRSMNAEIIARLEASLAPPKSTILNVDDPKGPSSDPAFQLRLMSKRIEEIAAALQEAGKGHPKE